MHELSIAMSLIDGVLAQSDKFRGSRVEAVNIKVGAMSGVDQDALSFSYEAAIDGTPLEGSRLVIESIPLVIFCDQCKSERTVDSLQLLCCPDCGSPAYQIVSGKELELTSLEVSS